MKNPWSPLRNTETSSPYRQRLDKDSKQFYPANYNHEEHTVDELRMKALLHAAIDSKDPLQRAASTPPVRLQLATPSRSKTPDLEQSFNQMDINNGLYGTAPYTVSTSTFPHLGYNGDVNRSRMGRRLEAEEYPLRPSSAQPVYTSAKMPPPGLTDYSLQTSDPTMNQVLATLIASGNLSMTQIQHVEAQLRGSPNKQWPDNGRTFRDAHEALQSGTSPTRVKDGRRSPGTASDASPTRRSALLEEFRNNKTKKYELRVIFDNRKLSAVL